MNFYKLVLSIAIIILIIFLVLIAVAIQTSSNESIFPPHISLCPDYYIYNSNTSTCEDPNNTDTDSSCNSENFNDEKYMVPGMGPESGICEKKKWANICNVNWDGITNNENVCVSINK